MKQATILKNGVMTHRGQFESQAELDAWLAKHKDKGTFGVEDKWEDNYVQISPAVYDESGNVLQEEVAENQPIQIAFQDYTVVQEDISDQLAQAEVNRQASKFLADSDWKILRHIREKALDQITSLTDEQYLALEQERADAAASIVR